jgi:hypothetical protein
MSSPGKERLEGFQRAIAATCRAIAREPTLNVSFRTGEGRAPAKPPPAGGPGKSAPGKSASGRSASGRSAPGRSPGEPPGLQLPPPRRANTVNGCIG